MNEVKHSGNVSLRQTVIACTRVHAERAVALSHHVWYSCIAATVHARSFQENDSALVCSAVCAARERCQQRHFEFWLALKPRVYQINTIPVALVLGAQLSRPPVGLRTTLAFQFAAMQRRLN